METTKLIVEYLIVGFLVCLSIIFLVFNILPHELQSLWLTVTQYPDLIGAGIIAMLLPIAYGIGLVAEYLGMLPYEGRFDAVKEKRFPAYVKQNLDWLSKSPLFRKIARADQPIPKDASKLYGEMRFFVLMNNAYLYEEIERHLNQVRILRALTIVEFIFIVGLIVQFMTSGISLPGLVAFIVLILLMGSTVSAIIHRFNQYCRAIERSFKALSLDEISKKSRK